MPTRTTEAESDWGEPHFDRHQFVKTTKAISASSRLSFNDFSRMSVTQRAVQQDRRLPTPAWALNDKELRAVVLSWLDRRYFLHCGCELTDAQRLTRIDQEARKRAPAMKAKLKQLMDRYHRGARNGGCPKRLAKLAVQIQNWDTQIVIVERGVSAIVTAVVWRYFRLGENSTDIAEALLLTSPVIRIWIYRIRHLADGEKTWQMRIGKKRKVKVVWDTSLKRLVREFRDKYKMKCYQIGLVIGCSWQAARYHYKRERSAP